MTCISIYYIYIYICMYTHTYSCKIQSHGVRSRRSGPPTQEAGEEEIRDEESVADRMSKRDFRCFVD